VRSVRLFGSHAAGVATPSSDVDLLVDYGRAPVSLLTQYGFQEDVQRALGAKVDILKDPPTNLVFPGFVIGATVDVYAA